MIDEDLFTLVFYFDVEYIIVSLKVKNNELVLVHIIMHFNPSLDERF